MMKIVCLCTVKYVYGYASVAQFYSRDLNVFFYKTAIVYISLGN